MGMESFEQNDLVVKAELLDDIDDTNFSEIFEIEKETSINGLMIEAEDLRSSMEQPNAITVVIRDEGEKISGFILGLPNEDVWEELHPEDPEFGKEGDCLYIYDLAISEKSRGLHNFLELVKKLVSEAKARNYKLLTMHTRVGEGLSNVLQKRYGAKKLRTLENWQGYGEPFDYLELEIK